MDIFPTLLEIAEAPTPRQTLDGESIASLFRDPAAMLKRDAIFQHFPGYLGYAGDQWRTTPVTIMQAADGNSWSILKTANWNSTT